MYELKRSELLEVEVKIGEDVIKTKLNLSKNSQEILKTVRELEVIKANLEKENDMAANLENLGEITIKLIKMFFGVNADTVLKFYSDESIFENERVVTTQNTEEMLVEVLPFLFSLVPKIKEFQKKKQKEINENIKGRKII